METNKERMAFLFPIRRSARSEKKNCNPSAAAVIPPDDSLRGIRRRTLRIGFIFIMIIAFLASLFLLWTSGLECDDYELRGRERRTMRSTGGASIAAPSVTIRLW
mmetsp:Transcript_53542/g.160237  ORF Transcript_53542/g.160237 Transcript_53542/m.160237 type:complete len:105 (-) Transcript_53542:189-503(-)